MFGTLEERELLYPTVLVRDLPGVREVVTAGEGEHEGLIVFRSPEDACAYQEQTGQHLATDGYKIVGKSREAIAATLEEYGLGYVHMPERWVGGDGGVDTFRAEYLARIFTS